VNVVIAAVLGIGLFAGLLLDARILETLPGTFVTMLLRLNLVMVVFNMIPAFPMDGGRVLRAILSGAVGLLPGTRVAVVVGTVFAAIIGLGGWFILHNPWMLLIGLFVIWAGHQELRALEAEESERLAEEDEVLRPVIAPRMHATIYVWDSARGGWVRRPYTD
jgi:Zn-dependent protease